MVCSRRRHAPDLGFAFRLAVIESHAELAHGRGGDEGHEGEYEIDQALHRIEPQESCASRSSKRRRYPPDAPCRQARSAQIPVM